MNGRKDRGRVGIEGAVLVIHKLSTFKSTQTVAEFLLFFPIFFLVYLLNYFFMFFELENLCHPTESKVRLVKSR